MLKKIVAWLKSLFKPKVEETFGGWVKDAADARDHIFGETK